MVGLAILFVVIIGLLCLAFHLVRQYFYFYSHTESEKQLATDMQHTKEKHFQNEQLLNIEQESINGIRQQFNVLKNGFSTPELQKIPMDSFLKSLSKALYAMLKLPSAKQSES